MRKLMFVAVVRSARRLLPVALLMSLLVLASSLVAAPLAAPPAQSWEANVSFARPNPSFPSITWAVDLRVVSSDDAAPVAYADFSAIRDGVALSHLTGSTILDPSQVTFGLSSTTIRNVRVLVFGGGGMQGLTFNVTWTKSGEPTAINSNDDGHTVTQLIPTTIDGTATMPVFDPSTGRVVTFTFGADSVTASSLQRVLVQNES